MPCSSTYCITNTGLVGGDDNYITGGTYNGNTYWTGQTSGWTIYYYTGTTSYWCLSDTLGGACYLTGKYPCVSSCPDLSSVYVFSGMCPTPTPTPTQNCDVLNFTALFDCEYIPTPTPTPSISVTPTPTLTPSSTNYCSIIGINASGYTYTPTPTPTPTVTPTQFDENTLKRRPFYSRDIVRDCPHFGSIEYTSIIGEIICPGSLKFQDCYNGDIYYTNTFDLPDGLVLQLYGVYGAYLNGNNICVSYLGNTDNGPTHVLTFRDKFYGFIYSEGDCILCQIEATPTPTPTMTQTPTLTPTMTKTPTPTVTATPGLSPSPTSTITPTMTKTPTMTPTITPSTTPSCSNDSVEGQSSGVYTAQWIVQDNSNGYYVTDATIQIKYFTQSTSSSPSISVAFQLQDSGGQTYTAAGPMVYNSSNNKLYIYSQTLNSILIKDLSNMINPVVRVSVGGFTVVNNMIYNSVNDRVYMLANGTIRYLDCTTNVVTLISTTGIYNGGGNMEYNPLLNKIYMIQGGGFSVLEFDCTSNTITGTIPGFGTAGTVAIHSLSYKPNSSDLYIMRINGSIFRVDCNNFVSTPTQVLSAGGFNFGNERYSIYNEYNDKIYIADSVMLSYVHVFDTVTQILTQVQGINTNPSSSTPYRFAVDTTNNKVFVSRWTKTQILQICASPHS